MEEPYEYVKSLVLSFKLNHCCYIAPVKVGLLIIAYFNIIYDLVSVIGMADESFSPTIMSVEEKILEDYATKPIPILCYSAEFVFNVILLCAVHRQDIVLLRVHMYCSTAALITSIMFYSVVMPSELGVLTKIALVSSIIFQCYSLLLVYSAMVEIKQSEQKHLPTIVMSSLVRETIDKETSTADIEAPVESDAEPTPTTSNEDAKTNEDKTHDTKLDIVHEKYKEIS